MSVRMVADAPLAPRTTMQVGGAAKRLVVTETERDLIDAVRANPRAFLLGGGSNVVVADRGVDEAIVIATRGIERRSDADRMLVTAAAGEVWDDFVAAAVAEGLSGIECLSGIPGLVGSTPIQNVGAYGQEVKDTIASVRAWDVSRHETVVFAPADCRFRYRDSVFKSEMAGRFVVLSVTFALRAAPPEPPRYKELVDALASRDVPTTAASLRETVVALRRKKGMVLDPADPDTRSAGSFFTNPIVDAPALATVRERLGDQAATMPVFPGGEGKTKLAAGWLIERAGFRKCHRLGRARLSSKHALAIVADEGATAADVVALAREIQRGVRDRFAVTLAPEPIFVGFEAPPLALFRRETPPQPRHDVGDVLVVELALERRHDARPLEDRLLDLLVGELRDALREVGPLDAAGSVAAVAFVAVHVRLHVPVEEELTALADPSLGHARLVAADRDERQDADDREAAHAFPAASSTSLA